MTNTDINRAVGPYGIDTSRLLAEVETVFGPPVVATLTGSLIGGFGNKRSDVDVIVVVDTGKTITQLPIMSYTGTARIDVEYYAVADLARQDALLRQGIHAGEQYGAESQWKNTLCALRTFTRLAIGAPFLQAEGWDRQLPVLAHGRLADITARWWEMESYRLLVAARWLQPTKPLLAAIRYADAVSALLSGRAARGGQLFMSRKWLGEKLRLIDDRDGLHLFERALACPSTDREALAVCREMDEVLRAQIPPALFQLHAELRFASGVRVHALRDEKLVTRWDMRAVTLPFNTHVDGTDVPLWSGPPDTLSEGPLRELFRQDMLWLGLRREGEEQ